MISSKVTQSKTSNKNMNIKLLKKVRDKILQEPTQFGMYSWYSKMSYAANCGTTACIAGWTVVIANKTTPLREYTIVLTNKITNSKEYDVLYTETKASNLLNLTHSQCKELFYNYNWPIKFREPYLVGEPGSLERASIAYNFINWFIKKHSTSK